MFNVTIPDLLFTLFNYIEYHWNYFKNMCIGDDKIAKKNLSGIFYLKFLLETFSHR